MQMISILKHAVMISFFVFVMMLLVDFIEIASKRRMSGIIKGGRWRQYTLASFLGSTPGCLGAFMNVSLYVHGLISFGAIVGGMIATSFVQDGHGMLPLLSYSFKDSVLIKVFNLAFGLVAGGALFVFGL
jgi:hypothetical protein